MSLSFICCVFCIICSFSLDHTGALTFTKFCHVGSLRMWSSHGLFCVCVTHVALWSYLVFHFLWLSLLSCSQRENRAWWWGRSQSRGSELLLWQAQIHTCLFFSLVFFEFFRIDGISPSQDKAASNLLPNSLVHQKWNEAIKFHYTTHKYQNTSAESHSSQKEIIIQIIHLLLNIFKEVLWMTT